MDANIIQLKILQYEYIKLCSIIKNIQEIIKKNVLIISFSKNQQMKILHTIIKKLNELYNNNVNNLFTSDKTINLDLTNEQKNEIQLILELKKNQYVKLLKKYNKYRQFIIYEPLINIKNDIINLCNIVGFTDILDIFYLIQHKHKTLYDRDEILLFINNVFNPFNIKIDKNNKIKTIQFLKNKTPNNNVIFDNNCIVKIPMNNCTLIIEGYITYDHLNISLKTSQLVNQYLYSKKNMFDKIINLDKSILTDDEFNRMEKINKQYAKNYVENLTITNIIVLNKTDFINLISDDYLKYIKLSNLTIVKLIKKITTSINLYEIYNTIKLLLMGNDDNISIANLLFNLLKDKKNNDNYIANIIYEQLNFELQLKLKKIDFNIDSEIEKIKSITIDDIDLKKQITLLKNMPEYVKKICFDKIDELKNSTNDTYKIKMYVNLLIQYPWISDNDDIKFKLLSNNKIKSKKFLEEVEKKLNNSIYGHIQTKIKIIYMLAKLLSVQNSIIQPIALVGQPGIGKTCFAQILSECLDIPFVQITMGGQNDGELLHGHGYTYSGAQPGLIVKKMVESGSARCIMYFDELDKCVSKNGQVNELMSILIHLTDPAMNKSFQDRFFQEISFPLNKVIFIFSFNDIEKIDKILLDRLEIIEIHNYSTYDKIQIAKLHLLKKICMEIGFDYETINFSDEILTLIIDNYTNEAGVRLFKQLLSNILLKLNCDRIYDRGIFNNGVIYDKNNQINITEELIYECIGKEKNEITKIHNNNMIGVINGLYTCDSYGGIITIQVIKKNYGDKFIHTTGNLQKIMIETIEYTFDMALNVVSDNCKKIFYKNYKNGLHVHCDDYTEKEGPSASVGFFLCFLSILLDCHIKNDYAVTGEISCINVKKIGGLENKIIGGIKAGVLHFYVPNENKYDVEYIKNKYNSSLKNINIVCVDTIFDVAKNILIDFDNKKQLIKPEYLIY